MSRWLVTQGDHQFSAEDLSELQRLVRQGRIGPGDMVQPPGASDWLYAAEVPELKGLLPGGTPAHHHHHDDDLDTPRRAAQGPIIAVLLVLIAIGGYAFYHFASSIPSPEDLELLGDKGLALTEMLVTVPGGVSVRANPEPGAAATTTAAKDARLQLLAKRGDWYRVGVPGGAEGWVAVNEVIPAYFFADAETRQDYDPIYNPDHYVFVKNSSWMQLPDKEAKNPAILGNITVFQFLLQNKSKFEMTDVKLLATIKDKDKRVLETHEIAIEGVVPPFDGTMVGTLLPDEKVGGEPRAMTATLFEELSKRDPDLALRWMDGIEVPMNSQGFVEANIDLLQIRAVPKKLD